MNDLFLALLAFLPIVTAVVMTYGMGNSREVSMSAATLFAGVVAWIFWRMSLVQIAASFLQGLWFAIEISFIIFAAIFFVQTLTYSRVVSVIRSEFARFTSDRRVQAILIAWFFGSGLDTFIGFTSTGGICCLLLASLGFPPACAVLMGVMGPMVASAFGALHTPIALGVASGLQDPQFLAQLAAQNIDFPYYLQQVTFHVAVFQCIAGVFMPLFMIMTMTRFFGRSRSWSEGLSVAPFAVFSGLAFTIPSSLTAVFVGPEFAPFIGALVGGAIVMVAIGQGILLPTDRWDFRGEWQTDWQAGKYQAPPPLPMSEWFAWMPFIVLGGLVLVSRLFPPISNFLQSYRWEWNNVMGSDVNIVSHPLWLPGVILFIAVIVNAVLFTPVRQQMEAGFYQMCTPIIPTLRKALPAVAFMCIYMNSSLNAANKPGMFEVMAQTLAQIPGASFFLPLISPWIGALGSFFTDTHTFSNVMFSSFQHYMGQSIDAPSTLFVALQVVGACAGNMVAFLYLGGNGVMVGMLGWESDTIRKSIWPTMWYLLIIGALGLIVVHTGS